MSELVVTYTDLNTGFKTTILTKQIDINDFTPEEIKEQISEMSELFYKGDKLKWTPEYNRMIVLRNINQRTGMFNIEII
jgi:hypothetical protein